MKYLVKTDNLGNVIKNDHEKVVLDGTDNKIYLYGFDSDFVDLGLTSHTMWATCNVGAKTPEEAGLYFHWADTQGYTAEQIENGEKVFASDYSDYRYSADGSTIAKPNFTKYCNNSQYGKDGFTDSLTSLEPCDDMASRGNSSVKWYVPSKADFEELFTDCTPTLLYQDGREDAMTADSDFAANGEIDWQHPDWYGDSNKVVGIKFTSKVNDNSILLPASGCAGSGSVGLADRVGYHWSSSLNEGDCRDAWYLVFFPGKARVGRSSRYSGFPVRGVFAGQGGE